MTIQEKKANHVLDKVFSYPEGIMSRREWLNLKKQEGWGVREDIKPSTNYNRTKFNRMNWEEQREYQKKCDTMIPMWKLYQGDEFYEITKTEYDYFLIMV